MKILALTAMIAIAATPSAAEWYGENGVRLIFSGIEFKKWTGKKPDYWTDCRVSGWHREPSAARVACTDGSTHVIEINIDAVSFDGLRLDYATEHTSDGSDGH